MAKLKIRKFIKEIHKDASKETKNYQSGLLNEHLIVASFNKATSEQLRGYRIIINKLLNERKISRLRESETI